MNNGSIIEQEAGVRIGQWVRTKHGRVGMVKNLRDVKDTENNCHGGKIEALVLLPSKRNGSEKEAHDPTTLEPCDPKPWEGMEATLCYPGDRYPYEVVLVHPSGKKLSVRRLHPLPIEGQGPYSDREGSYAFASNQDAPVELISFRKNGRWVRVGEPMNASGFVLGSASYYQDPHF